MGLDKISEERLFQNHSKDQIKQWCQGLQYFHYMRARAGHNCEGDSFAAHFRYDGREGLIAKLEEIGVKLSPLEEGTISFDPFGKYSIDDLDKIRYTIPGIDDLQQPKDVIACEYKVHIWVQSNRFEISVSGSDLNSAYAVSNKDFEVCVALEKELEKLGWKDILDEDIRNHPHCISKEKYPELY